MLHEVWTNGKNNWTVLTLARVICDLQTDPLPTIHLVHIATGAVLRISETEVATGDLFSGFPLPSQAIQ